jgi:hypothetical protein
MEALPDSPVLQRNAKGLVLFACAYECHYWRNGRKKLKLGFEYMHAENAGHARGMFWAANTLPGKVRLVEVAPVVGFEVKDNHGERLAV